MTIQMTKENAKIAAELYRDNAAHDIALMMRCSESSVRKLLVMAGVKIRTQSQAMQLQLSKKYQRFKPNMGGGYSMEMVKRIIEMYEDGRTIAEIGFDIGRSAPTVAKIMNMYKIKTARRQANGRRRIDFIQPNEKPILLTDEDMREKLQSKGLNYTTAYADNIDEKTNNADLADPIPRWVLKMRNPYSYDCGNGSSLANCIPW